VTVVNSRGVARYLLYKKVNDDINSIGFEIIKELKTAGINIKI
jgi:hypothetical protein